MEPDIQKQILWNDNPEIAPLVTSNFQEFFAFFFLANMTWSIRSHSTDFYFSGDTITKARAMEMAEGADDSGADGAARQEAELE